VDPISSTDISCVIVVDALDECVDDQPSSAILSVLGRFVRQLPSVKFIITGRPEPRIRTGFRLPLLEPFTQIFLLHEVELSSVDEDIRLYLQEKLTAVAKRRSDFDLSDSWPCGEDLTALTKKSSGLFIFASTLARFIESEHHELNERLQLIVTPPDSTVHEGRAGIDPLYAQVLVHAFSDVREVTVFANLRRVLGAVILAFNPLSRAQIAKILNIKTSLITTTLRHLHSVLLIPNEESKEIRVFHKSFPDFLQDRGRCSNLKFFIASSVHHGDMALGCLELLKKLKPNLCALPDFTMNREVPDPQNLLEDKVGGALRYACGYWAMHIQSSPTTNDHAIRLIASATEFFNNNALPWIEVMSLENRLEDVIHSIRGLLDWLELVCELDCNQHNSHLIFPFQKQVDASTSNLRSLAETYFRFTMHFFRLIQQSALHIYHSALPLSPKSAALPSTFLRETVQITRFYGRPNDWGPIIRTIKGTHVNSTCVAVIGHRIAVACYDGTVGIYDSVTGVPRLFLSPKHPTEVMRGSPDGSILFCAHRESPLITSWDIQTGGLMHTFTLKWEAKDVAVSLGGRHLACGFSNGSIYFWEVASKVEGPTFESGSPVTRLCWLAPEEQLLVVNEASACVHDVVAGRILHVFNMPDPVCHGAAYSQELNQLVIATMSGIGSTITIIDPQAGVSLASCSIQQRLSCFAFSQTTKELVCGMTHGLLLFDLSTQRWRHHDHPAIIKSVSTLSNGTAVANTERSGIQLLSLGEGHAPSRQLVQPTLAVYSLDEGQIVATVTVARECDCVVLLEMATMHQLLIIRGSCVAPFALPVVLCASLKNSVAASCPKKAGRGDLHLWKFGDQLPRWTVETDNPPSIGRISPTGARLVTFDIARGKDPAYICVRDTGDGGLLAKLRFELPWPTCPLDITFDSEDRFYFHHDTYRIPHVFVTSSEPGTLGRSIVCREKLPLVLRPWRRQFSVDDSCEWVVRGSKRICWIPTGYIGFQTRYCWAESTLVMVGQDETLRKFTFREQPL